MQMIILRDKCMSAQWCGRQV